MGGTMIAMTIGVSFLLGSALGIFCEAIGEWSDNELT
jgi:hypothetical protein